MAAKKSAKKPGKKASSAPKASKRAGAKKPASPKTAAKKAAKRIPARADKGDGEKAVQDRIRALAEPSKGIMTKLHALVKKHAPGLDPTVRWGFAVYSRDGKMLVVASPYTKYTRLGFTNDAGVSGGETFIEYTSADQVEEAKVAALLQRIPRVAN